MKDQYFREISYFRISLTPVCNFRCIYCMPYNQSFDKVDLIPMEQIEQIIKVSAQNGIKKIRFTGGEPLLREGLLPLCHKISNKIGIDEICLTTNGSFLKDMAKDLKKVNVKRINLSLDTLDSKKFSDITRGGKLKSTLEGLDEALKLGFKVKINTVLMGGINVDEISNLVELTKELPIELRFIELMRMGVTKNWQEDVFVKNDIVLDKIKGLKQIGNFGVASVYKVPGYCGEIGLISPISSCFCENCNRIRMTSDGKLKPCLHSKEEFDICNLSKEQIEEKFKEAVFAKPFQHKLLRGESETNRTMNLIGG
ncbi:GTP 3',8-cyclase MoaA [Peptoniphilus mikwangii]|uniref:GTP 3',8-cyclase MoaA n=1 Tax=Peptoniphilus mikwangii TaxID=1354300 RepID=UPI0004234CCA|nr:GTP 3',8-cyclase MoaA [Peptoniphilus mikwangii]